MRYYIVPFFLSCWWQHGTRESLLPVPIMALVQVKIKTLPILLEPSRVEVKIKVFFFLLGPFRVDIVSKASKIPTIRINRLKFHLKWV